MKKALTILLLALGVCTFSAGAQEYVAPKVEVSQEKVNIKGSVYYVHKVLEKQTVYSICKAYGTTEKDLLKANPDLKDGLKANSLIFIPVASSNVEAAAAAQIASGDGGTSDGSTSSNDGKYIRHRVKWYENVLIIANKYDVSQDEIIRVNSLPDLFPKPGTVILIPTAGNKGSGDATVKTDTGKADAGDADTDDTVKDADDADANVADTDETPTDPTVNRRFFKHRTYTASDPLVIALVLPFQSQSSKPSTNYLDFYSGALMGIEQMKEKGMSITLKVIDYDVKTTAASLSQSSTLSGCDIVIGPVEARSIPAYAEYCKENEIPFVSPMDFKADSLAIGNPCFFQMPASQDLQFHNFAKQVIPSKGERVTLIYNSSPVKAEKEYVDNIIKALDENGTEYRKISYNIVRGRIITDSLRRALSKSVNHKVIVASEQEAFASDVVRNLALLRHSDIPVTIYSSNKIRNFEAIDSPSLYELNLHFSAPYFVNYKDSNTRNFVLAYRALYKAEPTPYAFHGYDTFIFFATAFLKSGGDFFGHVENMEMNLLQSNIKFQKIDDESGYRNIRTRDVSLGEDYTFTVR